MSKNTDQEHLSIDIIIPVYNPGSELKKLLYRLQRQAVPVNYIFLMHTKDGQDLTWAQERNHNVVIIEIEPEEFDHGGTRDAGIRYSSADVVICMTQDAIAVDDTLIQRLIEPLLKNEVAVSYARQIPLPSCGTIECYTRVFNYPRKSSIKSKKDIDRLGVKTYFCSNVCAAYKKSVYTNLGGFEHGMIFNEDMIFGFQIIKAGYSIAYVAEAEVIHSHKYTIVQQVQRNFDLAVSQKQHPEVFEGLKSEKEGIRLVKATAIVLLKDRHPLSLIRLIVVSGAKYLGYKLGKNYEKLTLNVILKLTMNPKYWGDR